MACWRRHQPGEPQQEVPLWILGVGTLVLVGHFTVGFGYFTVAIMAILSVIIWIANKLDMS